MTAQDQIPLFDDEVYKMVRGKRYNYVRLGYDQPCFHIAGVRGTKEYKKNYKIAHKKAEKERKFNPKAGAFNKQKIGS